MSRRPKTRFIRGAAPHPLLPQAVEHHQAGRLHDAAKIYERIIVQVPRQFDAIHLLGVISLQEGHFSEAERLIKLALTVTPNDCTAISNLGTVYLRSGRLDSALECFERAVRLEPRAPLALENLGLVLRQLGRSLEALPYLKRAYSISPPSITLISQLGACFLETGDAKAAVEMFEIVAVEDLHNAAAWANLAIASASAGNVDRAHECAVKALALSPESSAALLGLAAAQYESGDLESAVITYKRICQDANANSHSHVAFADALLATGSSEEGLKELALAIELDGNNATARWKFTMAQCRPFFISQAESERARDAFSDSLTALQHWFRSAHPPEAHLVVGSQQPFYLAYQAQNNKLLLSRYGDICVEWMGSLISSKSSKAPLLEKPSSTEANNQKMRIGIVAAHVRDHPVWNAITKGWIFQIDKTKFDVHLFKLRVESDHETERVVSEVKTFENRQRDLQGWIHAIKNMNLDAVIYPEIGMDSVTCQLASLRLAPVQVAAWGHPETTGLPTIDLYVSSESLEPPNADDNYRETLVRLPNLGVYVEPLEPSIQPINLQALGLPDNQPLLLCPGTSYKYSPASDMVWVKIAKGLVKQKKGRLVFFAGRSKAIDDLLKQRLQDVFRREKLDFDAIVCLIPNLERSEFFGLMHRSAVMLDTIEFSGFNTALQAIECGLPVLAREGRFLRGRLASGIMRRMGLDELVAVNDGQFVQMAIQLAGSDSKLSELRREIAIRRHVIFGDTSIVRALENTLANAVMHHRSSM